MDKLGLGYDVLKEINPRIIYAAVSGFGCYGPYHLRPGYDILAQAMGGMMSITGSKGGEPTRAGSALGDILGAKAAGVIVGTDTPIVMCSRADTDETKLCSIALGCLMAGLKK